MPIYEYKCHGCGKVFDALQKIDAEPLTHCVYCKGSVEKLISASSFQFKGTGWYITDYKKSRSAVDKVDNEKSKSLNEGINNDATIK